MIAIVNVGPYDDPDPWGWRDYELRINKDVIATFKHKRGDGLSTCIYKAMQASKCSLRGQYCGNCKKILNISTEILGNCDYSHDAGELELLEDDLASNDEKRVYSAIRKIAEDDTGDATYIEQRLAEMLLSNLPCWISVDDRLPEKGLRARLCT